VTRTVGVVVAVVVVVVVVTRRDRGNRYIAKIMLLVADKLGCLCLNKIFAVVGVYILVYTTSLPMSYCKIQ